MIISSVAVSTNGRATPNAHDVSLLRSK